MQSLKTELGAEIRDGKTGEILRIVPFRRCHSLLKAFIQLLYIQLAQTPATIKDTSGNDNNLGADDYNFRASVTTETTFGMVIGTGDTPVTMTDHKLETQVTTNWAHKVASFGVENPNSSTWRVFLARGFTNNTGAAVTIKEVGLYVLHTPNYGVCIDRTLCSVTVQTGETLTLTYRITVTL